MSKKSLDKQLAQLKLESQELDKKAEEVRARAEQDAQEEKSKVEIVEEVVPYKVFGRDFSVSNPNYVQFYKNRMKMMAIQYKLLGKVDDEGRYVIAKDIKYDLIAMKKEIEEMGDDYYKVSSLYMKKYFNFTIKLTMLDDGRAKASLNLAEYAGSSVDNEMIYSHIADFIDVFDTNYRIKLRKAFNLVDADAKNNDFDIPKLAVLMQDMFDVDLYIGGLYDMASQIYIMRMLKILEGGGEVEKEVLARYKEYLAEMEKEQPNEESEGGETSVDQTGKKVKKEKNINEKQKELLDKAIDSVGGLEKLTVDKKQLDSVIGELNKTQEAIDGLSVGGMAEAGITEVKADQGGESKGAPSSKKKPTKKKASDNDKKDNKKPKKSGDKKEEKKPKKSGGTVYESGRPRINDIDLGLDDLDFDFDDYEDEELNGNDLDQEPDDTTGEDSNNNNNNPLKTSQNDQEDPKQILHLLDKTDNENSVEELIETTEDQLEQEVKKETQEFPDNSNNKNNFPNEQENKDIVKEVIIEETETFEIEIE